MQVAEPSTGLESVLRVQALEVTGPASVPAPAWARPSPDSAQAPHGLYTAVTSLYILLALISIIMLCWVLVNSEWALGCGGGGGVWGSMEGSQDQGRPSVPTVPLPPSSSPFPHPCCQGCRTGTLQGLSCAPILNRF